MLQSINIKRFRLLRDVVLDFQPPYPIVLVGPNGAGKSTFLEVIHLLSRGAAEEKGLLSAFQDKGGFEQVRTHGEVGPIEIEVTIAPTPGSPTERDGGVVRYGFALAGTGRGAFGVQSEWIDVYKRGLEQPPLWVLRRNGNVATAKNVATGEEDEIEVAPDELAIQAIKQVTRYPTLSNIRAVLRDITIYTSFYTAPGWARDPREPRVGPRESAVLSQTTRLDGRGFDLISALYNLREDFPDEWSELDRAFKTEFPFVKKIDLPVDIAAGRIALGYTDNRFGERFFGQQMSDGMLAYLSALAATLVPDHPAAIGFDEPEAHIHPSAQRRLVGLMERAATTTALIVATHSDRLLNYLSDPAKSVRICEATALGAIVRKLDPKALEVWLEDYTMAELRQRGHIDTDNADRGELS
ncbi:MAG: AAA family ATPase [Deltaproteobacteria bacterium]|nr:AAA family ATPase [Deltaproteobacteria bacterium]